MDRAYLEILSSCEEVAKKVARGPYSTNISTSSSFGENLEKIDYTVERLKEDGSTQYPLINIIRDLSLDKYERMLLYYFYGIKSAGMTGGVEDILTYLGNNDSVKTFEIKIKYLNHTSKLCKKEVLISDYPSLSWNYNRLALSKIYFDRINCCKEEEPKIVATPEVTFNVPPVKDIYDHLSKKVIGQEYVKRVLSTLAYRHYSGRTSIRKCNVMLAGPTGSGKTYLVKSLAEYINVPVYCCSANDFTCSGYVGGNVTNIIFSLLDMVNQDKKKAEKAIVFIDEIDKISAKTPMGHLSDRDVAGRSVQEELLKLVESTGEKRFYTDSYPRTSCTLNIENILWITAGAFSDINNISQVSTTSTIGFCPETTVHKKSQRITTDDLQKYGMIPEFLGRFPNVVTLYSLTANDMVNIMKYSQDTPLKGYIEYFANYGINLSFSNDVLEDIASNALRRKLGARGLSSVLEELLNPYMYEVEIGNLPPGNLSINKEILERCFASMS
ncbi:AAA family ATPase [bacterium]|nr:AAA family ATPase [bacterium]